MRIPSLILSCAAAVLLAGCQAWQPGGGVFTADKNAFAVKVPAGWNYTTLAPGGKSTDLIATKDGLGLQRIIVEHRGLKEELPHSKRTLAANQTPFEIAEIVADDLRADRALQQFEVKENVPATVGGQPGFKLVLNYQNADNLRLGEIRYGALIGERVYFLRFVAPARHYFARDLAVFEESAASFRLNKI